MLFGNYSAIFFGYSDRSRSGSKIKIEDRPDRGRSGYQFNAWWVTIFVLFSVFLCIVVRFV